MASLPPFSRVLRLALNLNPLNHVSRMNLRYTLRARKFRTKWDPAEIDWIMDNVNTDEVCFDIGTHKGGWTYWMRKAVGSAGAIFAFEPQPALHRYLTKLFAPNYWSNVTLENIAFSNKEGSFEMFVPGEAGSTSPGASLKQEVAVHEADTMTTTTVTTTTLDQYVAKHSLDSIAFIKLDVEGSEVDVIEGATTTLRELKPSWVIESEARHIGEDGVRELFSKMEEANYSGFFFSTDGLTPLSEFDFSRHQSQEGERFWDKASYYNNFLFTPGN